MIKFEAFLLLSTGKVLMTTKKAKSITYRLIQY